MSYLSSVVHFMRMYFTSFLHVQRVPSKSDPSLILSNKQSLYVRSDSCEYKPLRNVFKINSRVQEYFSRNVVLTFSVKNLLSEDR